MNELPTHHSESLLEEFKSVANGLEACDPAEVRALRDALIALDTVAEHRWFARLAHALTEALVQAGVEHRHA